MILLNFCFKEFIFGLRADSIVLVDFLHALGSIEGRFISAPNQFEQMLMQRDLYPHTTINMLLNLLNQTCVHFLHVNYRG